MEWLSLEPSADDTARQACVEALRSGGVVVTPTETVYGLLTLWGNEAGRQRIHELKNRPADKRLQMLAPDLAAAAAIGYAVDDTVRKLAEAFWPGPLTVVAESGVAGSIGLRIPDHTFVAALLRQLGQPLAATSANRSGEPAAATARAAVSGLTGEVDVVVDGGAVTGGMASTVISLVGGHLQVLRPGPISEGQIRAAVG